MIKLYLPIILMSLCFHVHAQQAFNNRGGLQVFGVDPLGIFLPFTNASTASFVNNGTVYIKSNITNDQASMANSSGSLYLDGSSVQSINGTQTFRIQNLITNNSSGFILNNNLSVGGVHSFIAGMITSSSKADNMIYEAGASYLGSSDDRHVRGWVTKIGTTSFTYPVGNASRLRSLALDSLSVASEFNVYYEETTTNAGSLAAPLATVNPYESWTVNQMSGGTAKLTLNWDNGKVSFPQYASTNIRVALFKAGLWSDQGGNATGDSNTIGSITSNTLSSFGSFTFGSVDFAFPLQFLTLTATREKTYTVLQWTTAQEFNIDNYQIERSDNMNNSFVRIGFANPQNTATTNPYDYVDYKHLDGEAYYRIKAVNTEGKVLYSNVVMVSDIYTGGSYWITNPVSNTIYLYTNDFYKGSYKYDLFNSSGQLVQTGLVNIESAGTIAIALRSSVARGSYTLRLKNGLNQITEKILVK